MKKKSVILVLVVGFAFLSSLVAANSVEECNSTLKLTPEQKAKMQKMCLEFQKEILPLQTDLKAKSLDIKTLLGEKTDLSKINAIIDEMAKIKAEMMKKNLAHHNQIMGLLTDEQKVGFGKLGLGCGMACGIMASGMHGAKSCGMSCGMKDKTMRHCPDKSGDHGKDMMHGCKK